MTKSSEKHKLGKVVMTEKKKIFLNKSSESNANKHPFHLQNGRRTQTNNYMTKNSDNGNKHTSV